jgi:hypothetical protein
MRVFIFFIFVFINFTTFAQKEEPETHSEWKLSKEKDGIKIYTRWRPVEKDREARELRGEMVVNVPITNIIQLIKDDEKATEWINRVKVFKNVKIVDDFTWYSYSEMAIPWPMDNQDMVTKNELKVYKNGKVAIVLSGASEQVPVKDGIRRIEHFEGGWKMEPLPKGNVKITYSMYNNSKPVIPRLITDPLVFNSFWSTLDDMRKILIKNKNEVIELPYLK